MSPKFDQLSLVKTVTISGQYNKTMNFQKEKKNNINGLVYNIKSVYSSHLLEVKLVIVEIRTRDDKIDFGTVRMRSKKINK